MIHHKLSNKNQLTILYDVEPGCLGLKGEQVIHDFCDFMSHKLNEQYGDNCQWHVQPRTNILKHHIHYQINKKLLNRTQAKQFLHANNKNIDDFENELDEYVVAFIEEYLGRSN